ncbi:MAG: hypothetical protein B7733_20275 [Myxococcales bacterium FL481]|nr:MAG: hypothetical protein B7733_20275 [Myxococcales bacterium FL481]
MPVGSPRWMWPGVVAVVVVALGVLALAWPVPSSRTSSQAIRPAALLHEDGAGLADCSEVKRRRQVAERDRRASTELALLRARPDCWPLAVEYDALVSAAEARARSH